jgi:4-amino-4-deoxy-L-arabinose transferase-like glycosyltransferase
LDRPGPAAPNGAPLNPAGRRWGPWLWLAGLLVLVAGLGVAPVSRTQEARVLETAREMLGSDTHNWLVPRVNGHIRLQKPPLAYWLTACSYKLLHVGEGVGRIPAAVAAWLTVGMTGLIAAWLFGRRAGLFAGAALIGSYLFFRYGRLAETDVLATLFVTAGVYAMWRAYALVTAEEAAQSLGRCVLWFHAAGAAVGLAVMAKGPPAAYPVLFLIVLCCVERRWKPLARFFLSGAPLTAAVIALPWFLYVRHDPMYSQLVGDLKNSAGGGRGHSGWFFTYIPPLFVGTAPWSVIWLLALIAAIRQWRLDGRLRGMAIWVGCILVPLSLWGNKQFHYLMPVMPPLMILVGWLLDESLKADSALGEKWAGLARGALALTAIVFAAASPGLVLAGHFDRGHILPLDYAAAALVVAGVAAAALVYRARGAAAGATAFALANVVILAGVVGLWAPTLNQPNIRAIPPALAAKYGDGPFAFIGKEDLPMVFHMRRIVPVARSDQEIANLAARQPDVVAIEPNSGSNKPRKAIVEEARFRDDETIYRVGRIDRSALPPPSTAPAGPVRDVEGE